MIGMQFVQRTKQTFIALLHVVATLVKFTCLYDFKQVLCDTHQVSSVIFHLL